MITFFEVSKIMDKESNETVSRVQGDVFKLLALLCNREKQQILPSEKLEQLSLISFPSIN